MSVLLYATSAWAIDVTVGPSTGTYYANGNPNPTNGWGPTWKSKATASDLTTPLLTFEGKTGMNTANGNIYSNQTYTLTAPTGYVIVGYTFNGTATGNDITITPAGGSGTTVTCGSNLGTPLSVDVNAQSTTFALSSSGDAHFENLALTVKVEHYIISYSTSTGSYTATIADGTWASRWESTATDPQVNLSAGANNIQVSSGNIYSGNSTATYKLTAQDGYVITGYEIKGTAQTAAQTLTPSAGGSAVIFGTDKEYTLSVTGLSAQNTTFTQSTPNNGIAISSFKIFLEKEPCTVTYVISDASGVIYTSEPFAVTAGETITALPSSLQRSYCTYSDINQTMVKGENTINVTCTFTPPFTVSTSFADATWYYATIRGSKYLRADDSKKDASSRYQTSGTNEETDAYMWAFFGNPYALYIANMGQGNGKYLNAGSVPNFVETNTPSTTTATLWEAITNGNGFNLRSLTKPNLYINDDANKGNLGYWNDTRGRTDDGGKWVVTEVPPEEEFKVLIAQLEAIPFGTGVNQYRLVVESMDYTSQMAEIISGIKAQGFTADNLATAQLLLASATLNLPSAGFYRIKGQTSGKYLAAGMANSKYAMSSATDATTIFYYDGTKVVNFGSGMANGMSQSSWNWVTGDAASTVEFADGETNGGYSFKSSDAFFYDGGTYADRGSSLEDGNARYRNWYLTEVTELPVTISAAGYATFNSPVAVEIPQGITAYQASVQNDDYIRLVSIDDGVIPANFPVVLKGSAGPYTFNITTTKLTKENYNANELKGSIAAMSVSVGGIYTLQRDSDTSVGFYRNAGTTFKGFSAYLEPASASRGFQMVSSTGIEHIATPILFENAYDLQGRKAGIVKKGVYIVNGKKVLF